MKFFVSFTSFTEIIKSNISNGIRNNTTILKLFNTKKDARIYIRKKLGKYMKDDNAGYKKWLYNFSKSALKDKNKSIFLDPSIYDYEDYIDSKLLKINKYIDNEKEFCIKTNSFLIIIKSF